MTGRISIDKYEQVKVTDLTEHPENPRTGSDRMLEESIRAHGQYRPIVAQRSTGYVLAGNHTLRAATAVGMEQVAVAWVDVDDAEARRIMLVDNRAADLGTYDDERLLALLSDTQAEFGELTGTGYDIATLEDLTALTVALAEAPHEDADGVVLTRSLVDGAENYANQQQRLIVLPIPQTEYEWTTAALAAAAADHGEPGASHGDTVMRMIAAATGTGIPT